MDLQISLVNTHKSSSTLSPTSGGNSSPVVPLTTLTRMITLNDSIDSKGRYVPKAKGKCRKSLERGV